MSDTQRQTMPAFNRPFLIGLAGETLAHVNFIHGICGGKWFERYRTSLLHRQVNPFCLSERYSIFCSADFLGPAQNSQPGEVNLLFDC